jgi:hypothetical protein
MSYDEIDFDVDVYVDKDIYLDVDSDVNLDGWTADAGADATADAGWLGEFGFTMAEAYTDAYATIGYSDASSFSAAAVDLWLLG